MPKTIYTEFDIEDLAKRGVLSLNVNDSIVLTDLAREKARRLGIELHHQNDPPPSAPEGPSITKKVSLSASNPSQALNCLASPTCSVVNSEELHQRVRAGVLARLSDSVDPNLLDTIIRRVLNNISTK